MEVRATHKIKRGEEITLNYDGDKWQCTMQKRKNRQEFMRAEYGFTCRCELCQDDEDLNDNDESYERFRKIMANKELLDNIINFEMDKAVDRLDMEVLVKNQVYKFEVNGTKFERYPGESEIEFKTRHFREILKSVEERHHCYIQVKSNT